MKIIELNNPNFNGEAIQDLLNKKICLVGVFSKLCVHCQHMKAQWASLKKRLKKSKCNGLLLEIDSDQLKYIDYSSLTNSIKGFPSIMVFKNGKQVKEYNGNRTSDNMFKFFKPYMVIVDSKKTRKHKKKTKTKKEKKKKFKRRKTIRKN